MTTEFSAKYFLEFESSKKNGYSNEFFYRHVVAVASSWSNSPT